MLCDKAWLEQILPNINMSGLSDSTNITLTMSIDSRTIEKGELFIALPGTQTDGHAFVHKAFERGALGALISNKACLSNIPASLLKDKIILQVPDTMQALIQLAKAWRLTLTMPIVGITGSIGKTSTKAMLEAILKTAGIHAYVSYKNQNTIIGVCLNLFKVTPAHTCAVFELGINDTGEMKQLVDVLRPTIGLITTITHAHAERIGSLASIAREKRSIFSFFSSSNIGIVCGDQPLLVDNGYHHPIARFGTKTGNHVQARKITIVEKEAEKLVTTFMLKWYQKKSLVTLPTHHLGMVNNAIAAATIAYHLNVPFEAVISGLENYQGVDQRFELKKLSHKKSTLINDCYNANPESMKAALIAFDRMNVEGDKIAILGNMLELGDRAIFWHRRIGRLLNQLKSLNTIILVGDLAQHMAYAIPARVNVMSAENWNDAYTKLNEKLKKNDSLILVKASHRMELNKLVDMFDPV